MSTPSSRSEFKQYCLRQLGAPVLEINLADEQCEDLIDDGVQFFQERHFDGVARMFLKYKITENDIKRGEASKATTSAPEEGMPLVKRIVPFLLY